MRQQWAHLLFLHWAWDAAAVQRTLPAGLTVDTFEGRAWIGLVPFFMRRVRPAGFPAVPGVSNFLELNVRTYVHDAAGRPGVWFYSLDCNRWLAVKVARGLFHLPYEHAVMSADISAATGEVDYAAGRCGQAEESRFLYRATGPGRASEPGSLEFFSWSSGTRCLRTRPGGSAFMPVGWRMNPIGWPERRCRCGMTG